MQSILLEGKVIHGAGRGKGLGAPTLNIEVLPKNLPYGVYVAAVLFEQKKYPSVLHWGPRPTFKEEAAVLEVHLLDVVVDLYEKEVKVEILERLRDVQAFVSPEALREQIQSDVQKARAFFA